MRKKFTMLLAALLACAGVVKAQITSLSELSNDKVYTLKSGRSSDAQAHYLLYHTDASDNLSSTYGSGHSMTYSDNTENFHFAIYKSSDKYYFFSVVAKKFIGNNDINNGAIPLVEIPTNDIEIRTSGNTSYNFVLSTNGTGALNAAATTGCHGVVNWTGGYSNLTDAGNIYMISEVGDLDTQLKFLIEERINAATVLDPARAAVNSASNTLVGAYTLDAVSDLSAALTDYDNENTTANFEAVKSKYETLMANGAKVTLAAGEQFTVKCVDDSRGYMVYSTVEGKGSESTAYLAGTSYADYHAEIDVEGIYKEWTIVAHNGKNYMYNVTNMKFINSETPVKFTDTPCAFNFISIENNLWEIQFEDNNKYLSFSPGWNENAVRAEGSIDDGCKFYIEKTGVSVSEDVVSIVEASFVNEWKQNTLATLDYVGGYPTSLREEINAVSTLAGTTAFDNENELSRVAFTPGYYFIKSTSNDNYATYNSNTFVYSALVDGEKLSAKHVMEFVQDGENMKLQVPNLGKSVVLADAATNSSGPSPIESEIANGSNFTIDNQGYAKLIVKGDNQVMRTENSGAINYWWGDTKVTWYLIPVTELEMTITEFASICLPFDVVPGEGVKAYAVTAVENDKATLVEKADIPAGEGAILKGNGTVKLKLGEATSDWTDNLLEGTTVNMDAPDNAYILSAISEMSGTLSEASAITANQAYIKYEAQIDDVKYLSLADAIAAAKTDEIITILRDITMDYGAREAYKTEADSITIDGDNHTLTLNQTNSDWSSFGMADNKKVVFKNLTINKSGYGATSGAWNKHAIIFSTPVEMNDVTVNNSMAVQGGATLNNVTINEANGYYGLWINGNGQTVTVKGGSITATNGGRGIKIADQYINTPAQVTLSVEGMTFNTAKKAAVLVSSTAGAKITACDVDITKVAADNVNFVWVDEDWAASYAAVEVTGATIAQESVESFACVVKNGDNILGYYKALQDAFDAATSDQTVTILNDVDLTSSLAITADVTVDLNGKNLTCNTGDVFVVTAGTLTIGGEGVVWGSADNSSSACAVWVKEDGKAVINGGTYKVGDDTSNGKTGNWGNDCIYARDNGQIEINGGEFMYTGENEVGHSFVLNCRDADYTAGYCNIVVRGGTFHNFNPGASNGENPVANFVADGYSSVAGENDTYIVGKNVATVGGVAYISVTDAINAAEDGATVQLLAGEIDEYIAPWTGDPKHTIEKSITIVGAADYATTLTGGLYLGYDDSGCREHTVTIQGIKFTGKGVLVAGQKTVVIKDNKFEDITDLVASSGSANENAISVIGKSIKATVTGNVIADVKTAGINLRNIADATVSGNTISATAHNSITITDTEGDGAITVSDNTLSSWGTEGEGRAIRINAGKVVAVTGNVMTHDEAPEEFVKITGTASMNLSANYWNGNSPTAEGMFATDYSGDLVLVFDTYYSDDAKTTEEVVNYTKLTLVDKVNYDTNYRERTVDTLTYTRTFGHTDWQALYVPFDIPVENMGEFEVYSISSVENDVVMVEEITSGTLTAHTPYLIKATSTGDKVITVTNARLEPTRSNKSWTYNNSKYIFWGTDIEMRFEANTVYVLSGGSWCQLSETAVANNDNLLGAFRVYLEVSATEAGAPSLRIATRGETGTTSIDNAQLTNDNEAVIYDLTGHRVEKMEKGIYIVNGKKVVIR